MSNVYNMSKMLFYRINMYKKSKIMHIFKICIILGLYYQSYLSLYYSLFKKFITKSIITSFSLGFDSAISNVNAANVLLSIVCFPFLYKIP